MNPVAGQEADLPAESQAITINNRLRRAIADALAVSRLYSADAAVRLAAAQSHAPGFIRSRHYAKPSDGRLRRRADRAHRYAGLSGDASYGHVTSRGVDTRHGVILYLEGITVSFDGFKALNNLNLDIGVGELRCIIGPNGAGKTTMMDVITGKTRATAGTVFFGQNIDLSKLNEAEIAHAGIGRKFQRPTVFENHTVFENLELVMKTDKRVGPTLELIRLKHEVWRPAGLLSHGQKQWLEIGMLLMQEPLLLLLDEPVAGMTDAETERTGELLNELKGRHSLVVVEHDMDFVTSIAGQGKVTVLHEGSVLAEGTMAQVQADQRVIEVYLGR